MTMCKVDIMTPLPLHLNQHYHDDSSVESSLNEDDDDITIPLDGESGDEKIKSRNMNSTFNASLSSDPESAYDSSDFGGFETSDDDLTSGDEELSDIEESKSDLEDDEDDDGNAAKPMPMPMPPLLERRSSRGSSGNVRLYQQGRVSSPEICPKFQKKNQKLFDELRKDSTFQPPLLAAGGGGLSRCNSAPGSSLAFGIKRQVPKALTSPPRLSDPHASGIRSAQNALWDNKVIQKRHSNRNLKTLTSMLSEPAFQRSLPRRGSRARRSRDPLVPQDATSAVPSKNATWDLSAGAAKSSSSSKLGLSNTILDPSMGMGGMTKKSSSRSSSSRLAMGGLGMMKSSSRSSSSRLANTILDPSSTMGMQSSSKDEQPRRTSSRSSPSSKDLASKMASLKML